MKNWKICQAVRAIHYQENKGIYFRAPSLQSLLILNSFLPLTRNIQSKQKCIKVYLYGSLLSLTPLKICPRSRIDLKVLLRWRNCTESLIGCSLRAKLKHQPIRISTSDRCVPDWLLIRFEFSRVKQQPIRDATRIAVDYVISMGFFGSNPFARAGLS